VPLTAGSKTIKPVEFSFFDPKERAYRTIATEPLPLEVKPPAQGSSPNLPLAASKNEVSVMTSDIRYIKSPVAWESYGGYLFDKPWFLALNAFPLLFLGLFFGYVRWQEKLSGDVAFARRLRASSAAKKFLKKARALLDAGAPAADYYNAVSRALLEFIANKSNVSADGLTTASIAEILISKKVPPESVNKVSEILEECNLVRFAPTTATLEMMKAVFALTGETIARLEKEMR